MDKNISIVIPASEDDALNIFDIALKPGTTVGETLGALDLVGYMLRTESEAEQPLGESDNLYARVKDGEKLFAAPKMDVG